MQGFALTAGSNSVLNLLKSNGDIITSLNTPFLTRRPGIGFTTTKATFNSTNMGCGDMFRFIKSTTISCALSSSTGIGVWICFSYNTLPGTVKTNVCSANDSVDLDNGVIGGFVIWLG